MKKEMKRKDKKVQCVLTSIILLIVLSAAWKFSGVLTCRFVQLTNFVQVDENLYVQPDLSLNDQNQLIQKVKTAHQRVESLYGSVESSPTIILGTDNHQLKKFGLPLNKKSGQTYKTLIGTFIVIAQDGLNEDVIAHEWVHAELAYRVGWLRGRNIPIWFDDGLATQVDYRPAYSEEAYKEKTKDGKLVPSLKTLETPKQFYTKDVNTRRLHYIIAKHEIKEWLKHTGTPGLLEIIARLQKGEEFYSSYNTL